MKFLLKYWKLAVSAIMVFVLSAWALYERHRANTTQRKLSKRVIADVQADAKANAMKIEAKAESAEQKRKMKRKADHAMANVEKAKERIEKAKNNRKSLSKQWLNEKIPK